VGQGSGGGVFSNEVSPASSPSSGYVKKLMGVVSRGLLLAVGIFISSRSFIDDYSFFFAFRTDVIFLTRSATSRPQPMW
jgi:hypothetical protein